MLRPPPVCFGEQARLRDQETGALYARVRELERELDTVVTMHVLGTLTRDHCMEAIDLVHGRRGK